MIFLLLLALLLGVLIGPGVWVRHVLRKYSRPADRYQASGTGAELARHLLLKLGLPEITVELTEQGDHYDPETRAVRLSKDNYRGASLTAVTVAAHEVGHAVQHARREVLFQTRHRLARTALVAERVGGLLFLGAPLVVALTRVPVSGLLFVALALGTVAIGTLVHLVTLPVEFDASFNKALPLLVSGHYLHRGDLPHARRILTAAALTYVAGSLASLLNVWRWLRVLRR